MRLSGQAFLDSPNKTVTLMGMSGVGKTTLANKLPRSRWFHYSGDYRIGSRYLSEPIIDNLKKKAMGIAFLRDLLASDSIYIGNNLSFNNLALISSFLGKMGNPNLGGLDITEFKRRQHLHREAEIAAMYDVSNFIEKARQIYAYPHFLNDAGGSICELNSPQVIEHIAAHTLIIYIKADETLEQTLIKRAIANPKPIYYQDDFLDKHLEDYLQLHHLSNSDEIDPDKFVQWIFPKSIAHRKPLYKRIADQYGYTINAQTAMEVASEDELMQLICDTLNKADN